MKLKNLFKPLLNILSRTGLNSTNPKSRIRAILEELEPGSPELENIAIEDSDLEVKSCAIHRLNNLEAIQHVLMKIMDDKAKMIAHQQFSKLLSGEVFPIPDLQDREAVIKGTIPNKTIEYVALHAKEAPLRMLAIHKINRDALLGDIALNDTNNKVKITAASQLGKKSTLERVCKQSRSKDKRVYKICKEKLSRIIDDEQRPQRINKEILDLCEQLERILKRNLLVQEETTILHLQEKWQEYKNFANEKTQQRYQQLNEKINLSLKQVKQQQLDELETIENLQQIIHNLSIEADDLLQIKSQSDTTAIEEHNIKLINSKLKTIELYKKSWNEQVLQINSKKNSAMIEQYQNILVLIEQAEEQQEDLSSIDLLTYYISQAEKLLQHNHYISEKMIHSLENKFTLQYQKVSSSNTQYKDIQTQFKQLIKHLKQRIIEQQQQYQQLLSHSEKLISEINNTLNKGQTDKAKQLKNQYLSLIEKCKVISVKEKEQMLLKIRSSDSQLKQLSSWKNWANNRERENLVEQAEKLLQKIQQSDQNISIVYENYGAQVKSLRSQWKKLTGRSPDNLWEQFNHSCNLCFELFNPYFEQQNKQREDNLALKEAICTQLEEYIEYMQWPSAANTEPLSSAQPSTTDWVQVNKILRQAKTEWQKIGPLERKQQQQILKKYNRLSQVINTELKKIWAQNQIKYQQLIEQLYALHKHLNKDLNKAINEAKALQSQWNLLGPVAHFQRQKLWNKFRKGCDIIFNKRDAVKKESHQKDEAIILEKTGLCENLEALIEQKDQHNLSIEDFKSAFADIENTWSAIIHSKSTKYKDVDARFKQAKKAFSDKIMLHLQQLKQQQAQLLQQKVALCTEMENNPQEKTEQNWLALERLNDKNLEKQLQNRFQAAKQLQKNPLSQSQLDHLYKEKEQLCLKLEIIMGINSPDEQTQKRLELQIEQMNSKTEKTMPSMDEIRTQWFLLPEFEEHHKLKNRFLKILGKHS